MNIPIKFLQLPDVPGIDALYQAMDMEEGVEVVWNEMNIACVPIDDDNLAKLSEKLMNLTKTQVFITAVTLFQSLKYYTFHLCRFFT